MVTWSPEFCRLELDGEEESALEDCTPFHNCGPVILTAGLYPQRVISTLQYSRTAKLQLPYDVHFCTQAPSTMKLEYIHTYIYSFIHSIIWYTSYIHNVHTCTKTKSVTLCAQRSVCVYMYNKEICKAYLVCSTHMNDFNYAL